MISIFDSSLSDQIMTQTAKKSRYSKKICLLGDFSVGKTSLVRRFVNGRFDDNYLSTIGAKVSRKSVETEQCQFDFFIWDLAGGDDFQHVMQSYLNGASAAILVCDLTRRDTLMAMKQYAHQLRKEDERIKLVFIGNKRDLENELEVKEVELSTIAALFDSPYLLTSAKTGENVDTAFYQLAYQLEKAHNAS